MTSFVSRVACMRLLDRPRARPRNSRVIVASHSGGSNARHHPPAHKTELHESRRVAGRVHAVVRSRRERGISYLLGIRREPLIYTSPYMMAISSPGSRAP